MKKQITGGFTALLFAALHAGAQPLAQIDVVALLDELPAPPGSITQAFERTYPGNQQTADLSAFYQPWTTKLEKAGLEAQTLTKEYYLKNPMGVQQPAKPAPASKASPQQEAAMNAATGELMQKMLSDPAFAQKFAAMSETEQHAYIAKLLADKGLKPVNGQPDTPGSLPPGSDKDWFGMSSEITQNAMNDAQWSEYVAIQQKYAGEHATVDTWVSAEIDKLPMYSYGEYGHDHDPEQVTAVRKQAFAKHREIAERMLKESAEAFGGRRRQIRERITPFNDALKQVSYGKNYDFGLHYSLVLGTQTSLLGELDALRTKAEEITREAAKWEYEYQNFK